MRLITLSDDTIRLLDTVLMRAADLAREAGHMHAARIDRGAAVITSPLNPSVEIVDRPGG